MDRRSHPANLGTRRAVLPAGEGRALLWGLLVGVLLVSVGAWTWEWSRQRTIDQADLPVLGQVRDFSLVERSGQPFGTAELKGRIWIAHFFFSSCTELCPRTMPEMARLQEALADAEAVRLVSITVDPEHDTPAVLSEFAQGFNPEPERWYFLTGDRQTIYDLSLQTFHMAVEQVPEADRHPGDDGFLHDGHFVLVDRHAQIRGYYDPLEDEAMARLLQDVQSLLR